MRIVPDTTTPCSVAGGGRVRRTWFGHLNFYLDYYLEFWAECVNGGQLAVQVRCRLL